MHKLGIPILLASLLCSCVSDRNVPPLLKGATAGGGDGDLCGLAAHPMSPGYAISPELTARISSQFPVGSPERTLRSELERQGFELVPAPCRGNTSVRRATITIPAGPDGIPYQTDADVYWAADTGGKITWDAGIVFYTGL